MKLLHSNEIQWTRELNSSSYTYITCWLCKCDPVGQKERAVFELNFDSLLKHLGKTKTKTVKNVKSHSCWLIRWANKTILKKIRKQTKKTTTKLRKHFLQSSLSHACISLNFGEITWKWKHGVEHSNVTSGMWNTKLDSISPLISAHIRTPPGESSDMHYGQMESSDFVLCSTFNRQLLCDWQHCNVFLAGAQ